MCESENAVLGGRSAAASAHTTHQNGFKMEKWDLFMQRTPIPFPAITLDGFNLMCNCSSKVSSVPVWPLQAPAHPLHRCRQTDRHRSRDTEARVREKRKISNKNLIVYVKETEKQKEKRTGKRKKIPTKT